MTRAVLEGAVSGCPDVESFLALLARAPREAPPELAGLFDPWAELVVTRAPGRLDVMGGIADYSGSLVLELPIREAALVALQRDPEGRLRIVSLGADANRRAPSLELPLAALVRDGAPASYVAARERLRADPATAWAAYVAGAFVVLARERGTRFDAGARILVASDVPEGKGVASSAALEVAVLQAVAAGFGLRLTPLELALLAQKVENEVVGAPCGAMDQITAACGEEGRLLEVLCQPAELRGSRAVPSDLRFWGIDSDVRHSVAGSDYTSVRVGAFMGYRMLAAHAGFATHQEPDGRLRIDDPRWRGFLANLAPAEFQRSFASLLPERMEGREFLARYGGTSDPVTRVEPGRTYAVRAPTAHPIEECFRVRLFAEILEAGGDGRRELLGELMAQSHASYSSCGLGSEGTDRLVNLAREAGTRRGIFGAKITGGGGGGTVALLGRADAEEVVAELAARYAAETGRRPRVFAGSSPGAAAFGHLRLGPSTETARP